MVGSSARLATARVASSLTGGAATGAGGTSTFGGCGGGGIITAAAAGVAAGGATGSGGGGGVAMATCVGSCGRAPGMNEKSSAKDDEIHGTCSLREGRVTPTRVRFRVSSAIRSGTRISFKSSLTNRLCAPPVSLTTELSAAEYITSVPFGAITGARPAEKLRNRRSNGLRLEASISAIFTPAPRLLISLKIVSRLTPSRRTSGSVQICASIGIRKLWRADCTPKPEKKISATEPGLIRA